jgi:hypothetical protein
MGNLLRGYKKRSCIYTECKSCGSCISNMEGFCSPDCKFEHGYFKLIRYSYKDIPNGCLLVMEKSNLA